MNLTVILGAMALVGADRRASGGASRPDRRRPAPTSSPGCRNPTPPRASPTSILRQLGQTTRRLLPNPLVDGLEVKLVQAGHPYGLDLPRILGIKITLAGAGGVPAASSPASRSSR